MAKIVKLRHYDRGFSSDSFGIEFKDSIGELVMENEFSNIKLERALAFGCTIIEDKPEGVAEVVAPEVKPNEQEASNDDTTGKVHADGAKRAAVGAGRESKTVAIPKSGKSKG